MTHNGKIVRHLLRHIASTKPGPGVHPQQCQQEAKGDTDYKDTLYDDVLTEIALEDYYRHLGIPPSFYALEY